MKSNPDLATWDLPKQTFLVEEGKVGDCWRCCIAAVVQTPAAEVPHFMLEEKEKNGCSCDPDTQQWLNGRGWCLINARQFIFPRWHGGLFRGLPVIAIGPTERSRGRGKFHAVVMLEGKLVYDPHPSNAGLTAVTEEYVVVPLRGHLTPALSPSASEADAERENGPQSLREGNAT
jgi:hypothetical protein